MAADWTAVGGDECCAAAVVVGVTALDDERVFVEERGGAAAELMAEVCEDVAGDGDMVLCPGDCAAVVGVGGKVVRDGANARWTGGDGGYCVGEAPLVDGVGEEAVEVEGGLEAAAAG